MDEVDEVDEVDEASLEKWTGTAVLLYSVH
jgi:hypothetical protein